jgi:hypothetical protein
VQVPTIDHIYTGHEMKFQNSLPQQLSLGQKYNRISPNSLDLLSLLFSMEFDDLDDVPEEFVG